jgi:MFS transporter, DHA2 family, multidrug resistance protein
LSLQRTQILPQLLRAELGYTAMLAGLVLSPGGLVTMVMMPITGKLIGTVQPRYLIMAGAAIAALAMWHLTGLTGDISYGYAAMSRIYLAVGLPLLFLPVTTASYEGLPQDKTNQASARINVARNLGGSMGVALVQTILAQRQQFHQSRLVEHIAPSDIGYQHTIDAMTRFFQAQGSNASDAASQAVAWVGQTLQHQVVPARLYRRLPIACDHRRDHDPDRAQPEVGGSERACAGTLMPRPPRLAARGRRRRPAWISRAASWDQRLCW